MKKFKNFSLMLLLSFAFVFSGGLFLHQKTISGTGRALAAESFMPSYLTVQKYTSAVGGNPEAAIPNSQTTLNDAVFLNSGQILRFELANTNKFPNNAISSSQLQISVNNELVDNKEEYTKPIVDNPSFHYISIDLNPYGADPEGKYEIKVRYMEHTKVGDSFTNAIERNLTFTFYLYKTSSYFITEQNPLVIIENVQTTIAGNSSVFAKTHEFNYDNNLPSIQTLGLPMLTYDSNKFEIEITKTYSGITQTTKISKNSADNIVQTNPLVLISTLGDDVTLTFNDLGSYMVSYVLIYRNGSTVERLANINNNLKPDRYNIFGFQIYHADINASSSSAVKEFKAFSETNKLIREHQTDITYTNINVPYNAGALMTDVNSGAQTYTLQNIDSRVNFDALNMTQVASTNQAPVTFKYNGSIIHNNTTTPSLNSFYLKLNGRDGAGKNIWTRHTYTGLPFTDAGTYLVKITYTSTLSLSAQPYTQWFLFTISNQTPSFTMKDSNGDVLTTDSFTKNAVEVMFDQIASPFDSASQLAVSSRTSLNANYGTPTVISQGGQASFTQNGIYRVVISFGKGLSKSKTSYFTIDNSPITGLTTRNVSSNNGLMVKTNQVDFFTNQSVAVEWNEKTSNGNTTSATYKFIPITQQLTTYSASNYESFYNLKYIPVQYELNYNKVGAAYQTLSQIPYSNTLYDNTLDQSSIFTEQGLYLFRVVDKAGNESFSYFVIDKTNPVILQRTGGSIVTDFTKLNLVANDTEVYWGKYKLIKTNINLDNMDFTTWLTDGQTQTNLDEWLWQMLKNKASFNQLANDDNADFKLASLAGVSNLYMTPKIKTSQVRIQVNTTTYLASQASYASLERLDDYGHKVYVLRNNVLYEDTYWFFVSDESNTLTQTSSTHNFEVSTDISKTALRIETSNAKLSSLVKHAYEETSTAQSTKNTFYMPINHDIVQLQYSTTTDEAIIEIDKVLVEHYEYISNYLIYTGDSGILQKNEFYTLEELIIYTGATVQGKLVNGESYSLQTLIENGAFDNGVVGSGWNYFTVGKSLVLSKKPSTTITVYDYTLGTNLGTFNSNEGLYIWNINTSPVVAGNPNAPVYRTIPGKYVVTRTYRTENGSVAALVDSKNDFVTRSLTFILDRSGVISTPTSINTTTNPNGTANPILVSLVGGSAYIEVLAGNAAAVKFNQLYKASSTNLDNILETNKLPVKIAIPLFKFGQVLTNSFLPLTNNLFYTSNPSSYINSFEMLVTVTHLSTGEKVSASHAVQILTTQPTSGYFAKLPNGLYLTAVGVGGDGYIVFPENFTAVGNYRVEISQKNTSPAGSNANLIFGFGILNIAPNFEIRDTNDIALIENDTTKLYYTNKNTLRIVWEDSVSEFLAKIDKNNLVYSKNGLPPTKISISEVQTLSNGLTHFFDFPINGFAEQDNITFTLSYEGSASDYPPNSFSVSKTVVIDRTAPTTSLNNLISRMGESAIMNANTLREGHNLPVGSNRTIRTGIFQNFAFAVDISDFQNLIFASVDHTKIFYRHIPTKYSDLMHAEFDPAQNDFSLYQEILDINFITPLYNFINSYVEIIEIDFAGNITVYSIYLTNIAAMKTIEDSAKADNANYKQTLSYDYKVMSYTTDNGEEFKTVLEVSEASNNLKVFAKDFFNLTAVNPYGYKWFLLTINNVKYLSVPDEHNSNTIYKITANGYTETTFAQAINLSLSNNNYTITINNLPKQNLTVTIIVSNKVLTFIEPTANNAALTIRQVSANASELVRWTSVEIWEFKNTQVSAYAKFIPSETTPVTYEPEIVGFNLARFSNSGNNTTFTVAATTGAYYRYKVLDNFGREYVFYQLYGNEYVDKIISLDGPSLVTDQLDGTEFYLSRTGFKFSFFHSIMSVYVRAHMFNTTTGGWEPLSTGLGFEITETKQVNNAFIQTQKLSSYTTVFLNPSAKLIEDDNFLGDMVIYEIKTVMSAVLSNGENQTPESEEYNFRVYNLVPKITLKGKNKQDLTALLTNSSNLTSEPITVEFQSTSNFNYPVRTYISFNNQTPIALETKQTFTAPGTYTITQVFEGKMSTFTIESQSFTISNETMEFFSVVQYNQALGKYVEVFATGSPYIVERPLQIEQATITQHYIVNTPDFRINLNTSQLMEEITEQDKHYTNTKKGITTFVRTVSNKHQRSESTLNYYETTIAITYIPATDKLVKTFYYLDSQGRENNLTYSEKIHTLVKDIDTTNSVTIYWNNYHEIPENKISVEIRYGQDNKLLTGANIVSTANMSYVTLSRSGNYLFSFKDLAGNTHKFDYNASIQNSTNSFSFVFISSVIFTVNSDSPIPYAIYNDDVVVTIPSYTISYYDTVSRPTIIVERNGMAYTGFTSSTSSRIYTFTEAGLYKVTFSAKRDGKAIKETPHYFQIIRANELMWAFSIEDYNNSYISKISKNGVDVTTQFINRGLGDTIKVTKNGVTSTYLRNLFVSLYDEQTGAGTWSVTIATNNDLQQTYSYAFKINSATVPISISQKQGTTTTKPITVSFNARNIYEEVGDAIVKIGNKTYTINAAYFNSNNPDFIETEIVTIGETYVQIFTPSERLLFSYKVSRRQPLNAVAVVVIVVSSLVTAGGVTMFVLLRKKMKIR